MDMIEKRKDMIDNLDTKGSDEPTICNVTKNKHGREYISTLSWKEDGFYKQRPNNAPNNITYNEEGKILSQSWCRSDGGNGLFDDYMDNTYGPASIFTIEINGEVREKFFYYLKGQCQNDKIEKFVKENNLPTDYVSGKELPQELFELFLLNYSS